jgi:hypothetical protein
VQLVCSIPSVDSVVTWICELYCCVVIDVDEILGISVGMVVDILVYELVT